VDESPFIPYTFIGEVLPCSREVIPLSSVHYIRIALLVLLFGMLGTSAYLFLGFPQTNRLQTSSEGVVLHEPVLDPEVAQRPGVEEVRKLGGRVVADEKDPGKPITAVRLTSTGITDEKLKLLSGWKDLRLLDLSGTKITDAGLKHLQDLTRLETLYLPFTAIAGDGFASLQRSGELKRLDLSKTQVGDQALAQLKPFTKLAILNLTDAPITDAGLEHLQGLTSLRQLDLTGTTVSDAGLKHLYPLTGLEKVHLAYTQVTDEGCAALRQHLPTAQVNGYQD
jgi:hypothetical protein